MHMGQKLTHALLEDYGDRKKPGNLSVVTDVLRGIITPVPRDVEHIVFVARYLKVTKEQFKDQPALAARIVPTNIQIENGTVVGVVTGICGMELGLGVRHTPDDLQKAHNLVMQFIAAGEFPANLRLNKVIPL
jgi:hypothetical protein